MIQENKSLTTALAMVSLQTQLKQIQTQQLRKNILSFQNILLQMSHKQYKIISSLQKYKHQYLSHPNPFYSPPPYLQIKKIQPLQKILKQPPIYQPCLTSLSHHISTLLSSFNHSLFSSSFPQQPHQFYSTLQYYKQKPKKPKLNFQSHQHTLFTKTTSIQTNIQSLIHKSLKLTKHKNKLKQYIDELSFQKQKIELQKRFIEQNFIKLREFKKQKLEKNKERMEINKQYFEKNKEYNGFVQNLGQNIEGYNNVLNIIRMIEQKKKQNEEIIKDNQYLKQKLYLLIKEHNLFQTVRQSNNNYEIVQQQIVNKYQQNIRSISESLPFIYEICNNVKNNKNKIIEYLERVREETRLLDIKIEEKKKEKGGLEEEIRVEEEEEEENRLNNQIIKMIGKNKGVMERLLEKQKMINGLEMKMKEMENGRKEKGIKRQKEEIKVQAKGLIKGQNDENFWEKFYVSIKDSCQSYVQIQSDDDIL